MRKLRRQVKIPSRIRRHHVLLAVIGVGLGVHEANNALRWFGESKEEVAQQTERRMLDELELWSLRSCPASVRQFHVGDGIDPWGREYRVICDESSQQMTVAIMSLGPDDGDTHDAVTVVRTFGP